MGRKFAQFTCFAARPFQVFRWSYVESWTGGVILLSRQLLQKLLPFWIAALFFGSFLPEESKRAIGTQSGYVGTRWGHFVWHVGSFGATGLLVSWAYRSRRVRMLMALFAMCVVIELLQWLLFPIQFEWWDIRDDGLGILVGALLGEWGSLRRRWLRE